MDKLRFYEAKTSVLTEHKRAGIGTLGERTTHAVLKKYFEPYEDDHERKIGNFVADIVGEDGIIEIQTRDFHKLRPKLAEFLKYCHVTVVYPVSAIKNIICFDPDTGEVFSKRRSPLKGDKYTVFAELAKIADFLRNDRFSLCVVFLETDEYRVPREKAPAYQKKKKRKNAYAAYDKIPSEIIGELHVDYFSDWLMFLPDGIPEEFTTADMEKRGMNINTARLVMNVFRKAGIVSITGKKGNSYVYRINEES